MCSEQWALHTHTHTHVLSDKRTHTLAQWSRRSTLSNPAVYPSKDFLFLFFFVPPPLLSLHLRVFEELRVGEKAPMFDDALILRDRIRLLGDAQTHAPTQPFEEEAAALVRMESFKREHAPHSILRVHTSAHY